MSRSTVLAARPAARVQAEHECLGHVILTHECGRRLAVDARGVADLGVERRSVAAPQPLEHALTGWAHADLQQHPRALRHRGERGVNRHCLRPRGHGLRACKHAEDRALGIALSTALARAVLGLQLQLFEARQLLVLGVERTEQTDGRVGHAGDRAVARGGLPVVAVRLDGGRAQHVLVRRLQLFRLQVLAQLLELCGAEFRGVAGPRLAILAHKQAFAQREQGSVGGDGGCERQVVGHVFENTAVAYCPSRCEGQCSQFSISCVACRRPHRLIIARTSSFLSERGMR